MEILKFPHKDLFTECTEVTVFGPELRLLLNAMWDTMIQANGLGLAANQVGILYRMFVMQDATGRRLCLVNPKIIRSLSPGTKFKEGCLSAPGEFVIVKDRFSIVEVSFQDENGEAHTRVFKGMHAICVQHEIEHLNGKSHLQSGSIPLKERKQLAKKWRLKLDY